MQSFIQYRKFKAAVQTQLEREKARAQHAGQQEQENEVQESPPSAGSDEEKDLEKGLEGMHTTRSRREQQHPPGVNPGETDPRIRPPLPKEEEETMQRDQRPQEWEEEVEEAPEFERAETKETKEEEDDEVDFELAQHRTPLSRQTTQQSVGTALGNSLTGIEIRKRSTKEGGEGNVFVVGYQGENDPNDPHNWSLAVRIPCTVSGHPYHSGL
jgi:hypothetical protein